MKKVIAIFMAFVLLLSFGSCAKTAQPDLQDDIEKGEVTTEPFESMEKAYNQFTTFIVFDDLKVLEEHSKLIVVATPTTTFTDEKPSYFDMYGNPVDTYEQADKHNIFTMRNFKVTKVLKGDKNIKNVTVAERFYIDDSKGRQVIVGYKEEYVAKMGCEYLLFLEPLYSNNDIYQHFYNVGKINIDGKDINCENVIDTKLFSEVKDKYSELFE